MQQTPDIPDKLLVNSVIKGDHLAFDRLFTKYNQLLFVFLRGILKDEAVAEEAVQDVFLKIWIKRKELDSELSFKSYLFTIAANTAKKLYRRKLIEEKYKQQLAIDLVDDAGKENDENDFRRLLEYIDKLINKLPPARRQIFILSKKEGLKNQEIANMLNITEQTVKNQLVAAMKFLKNEAVRDNNELGLIFFLLFYSN